MDERSLQPTGDAQAVAVVDVGSTSIRMAVAEIDSTGRVRTLESLSQAVSLGKDTFTQGKIRRTTIEECVRVLGTYRRKLDEYQIDSSRIRVVATSAVREADNRLAFLDRVYIATGIEVDAMDEAEVNRITYLGIQPFLDSESGLSDARTIVIEVGGGATEILLVEQGNVTFSHTYRLGSLRLRKTLEPHRAPSVKVRGIMETQIRRTVQQIRDHVPPDNATQMIAIGGDVRFAARQHNPDWQPSTMAHLPVGWLKDFTNGILGMTDDELVRKYHLSFPAAENVGLALLVYLELARAFALDAVMVTNTNLRDGLLQEMAFKTVWTDEFRNQMVRSAVALSRRFDVDEAHSRHVAEIARKLFQQLQHHHQLAARDEVTLYIAAILHEIGSYISARSMHKHTMYLIRNSEIFGLGKRDLLHVALVARYHRRASPQPQHEGYSTLGRRARVAVSKMAAILRVAIALDESRSQRITDFETIVEASRLIIAIPGIEDLSLEQLAISQNGSLFEEVFGMKVLLRTVRG